MSGTVREEIEKARKSGAYTCAPKELALAVSHVDFAETELGEGDFLRAQEHMDVAIENAQAAVKLSEGCGPKRVIIKKNLDKDGDGIVDTADACPERPEDFDEFEDVDGCPDPDTLQGSGRYRAGPGDNRSATGGAAGASRSSPP